LLKERKEILRSFHAMPAPPKTGRQFTRDLHSGRNTTLIGLSGENL